MTREQEKREAARKYATHDVDTKETDFYGNYVKKEDFVLPEFNAFLEGCKWSDENPKCPWISTKDDLPCNHEDLVYHNGKCTVEVLVRDKYGNVYTNVMRKGANNIWFFAREQCYIFEFWMRIPELPKE